MNNPINVSDMIRDRIRRVLHSENPDAFATDADTLRSRLSSEFDDVLNDAEIRTRIPRQEVITQAIKAVVASEQVESSIDSRIAGLLLRQADLEVPLRTTLNRVERACALHFILLAVNDGKPDHHALSDNRIREVIDRLVDQGQVSVIGKTDNYGELEEIIQRGPDWSWVDRILRLVVGLDKEGKIQVAGLFLRALGILATIGIAVWLGPSPAVCDFPVISAMGWCQSPESSMPVSQAASTQALPTPIQASTAPPTQSPAQPAQQQVAPAAVSSSVDRAALIDLFNSTDGENWKRKNLWATERPLGEWDGVTTDANGRVTALRLGENGLDGEIRRSIGDLANLQSLGLADNQLEGPIPSELSKLSDLVNLVLAGNQLEGPIPSELGSLSKLRSLQLHNNRLSGEIPYELGNLRNLETLTLANNILSSRIPSELGSLSNLKNLQLSSNSLHGTIPSELGNLRNLETLTLTNNKLSSRIPSELGSLSNLKNLQLSSNSLHGTIPSELGNLRNLEILRLSSNSRLSGCIPKALRDVDDHDLKYLGLLYCR